MENRIDTTENQNGGKSIIPGISKIKMNIWYIACIILFAAGIVFLIVFWNQAKYDYPILHYKEFIFLSALAAIIIIFLCFVRTPMKITSFKFVFLIIAAIVLAVGWYIYFRYIPKYFLADACAIVNLDPKYASATVEPRYDRIYDDNGILLASSTSRYEVEGNPFWETGYILNVIKDGKVTAWIAFDSVTGKYELFYEPKDEYVQ